MMKVSVPKGWASARLRDLADLERDSIQPADIATGTTYVGLEHIVSDGTFLNVASVDEGELASSKFSFSPDHLLYGKLRPYLRKIIRPDFHGVCSTDILPLKPSARINKDYLFHYLRQPSMVELATSRCSGANLPRLSPQTLLDFPVILPPFPEQKRIAAILDKADFIRRKRQEAVLLTEELLRSAFLDMFGDPIFNPKKWRTVHLTGVCNSADDIKCGPFGTQLGKDEFTKEGVPLWGIKNVNKFFELPTHEFLAPRTAQRLIQYSIEPGDIVMTRKGTIGNCAVYPENFPIGIMHSDLLRLRVNRQVCEPAFLAHQLHYSRAVEQQIELISGGAIMPGINVTKLKHLEVFVPPVDIQREFTRRTVFIKKLRNTNCTSLFDFENLFNSLLSRSFHGEM